MTTAKQGGAVRVHLLFHGIGSPGPNVAESDRPYFVSRDLFWAVLDEIRPVPNISISFDDGYASDVEVALPALVERGLSARFFPLAGRLGQPGYLDSSAVRELARAGMTLGTHGMRHRSWRRMSAGDIDEELVEARHLLSAAVGAPIEEAACPFGDYDRGALAALRSHGYRTVYTSDRRRARADAWLQPRYTVGSGDCLESVRAQILAPPSARDRAVGQVKGWLKSCR